jgi:hypothetical protein
MFGQAPQRNPKTVGYVAARLEGCAWEGAIG